jgi:hypothetical protein
MVGGDGVERVRQVGMFCTSQAMPPMTTMNSASGTSRRHGDFRRGEDGVEPASALNGGIELES